MVFEVWLAFASTCFALSVIPGPSVLVVTSQAISNGRRSALICILGELLGGVCLMVLSLLGVGAILATSPVAFQVLKWLGVIYLLYLGFKEINSALHVSKTSDLSIAASGSFSAGYWTALFNPKSLVFYLAFFTQFVDSSQPLATQYAVLIPTAAGVAGLVLSCYALFAGRIRKYIDSTASKRKFSGISGVLYIACSALVAITR